MGVCSRFYLLSILSSNAANYLNNCSDRVLYGSNAAFAESIHVRLPPVTSAGPESSMFTVTPSAVIHVHTVCLRLVMSGQARTSVPDDQVHSIGRPVRLTADALIEDIIEVISNAAKRG